MTDKTIRSATKRINHSDYIELQFTESSRLAVDELIEHLLDIISEHSIDDDIRLFVHNKDLRRGQPITYLLGQLKAHRQHFDIPFRVRVAANFNIIPIAQLLELFLRSLYSDKIKFKAFVITDAEGAVEWLLSE